MPIRFISSWGVGDNRWHKKPCKFANICNSMEGYSDIIQLDKICAPTL